MTCLLSQIAECGSSSEVTLLHVPWLEPFPGEMFRDVVCMYARHWLLAQAPGVRPWSRSVDHLLRIQSVLTIRSAAPNEASRQSSTEQPDQTTDSRIAEWPELGKSRANKPEDPPAILLLLVQPTSDVRTPKYCIHSTADASWLAHSTMRRARLLVGLRTCHRKPCTDV